MVDSIKNKDLRELKPRIIVMGVGGAGGNALNNMVAGGLMGVEFIAANTDAQALLTSKAEKVIQIGAQLTEGLGAGSRAEIGAAAAEEAADELRSVLDGAHMVFVTAGMGGGTGSGAAPVISRIARELGILTVGVVTKPFQFEGLTRMNTAEKAITRLRDNVDTLIVIPNQNLFRITNEQTTFSDAFAMADKVLHSGISCITDLMVKEGLINLDFADVKIVMSNMGKSMMGSGIASGENRGREAAEIAITNPLLDDVTLEGAKGVLISIIGGKDLTLFEVEQAAETIRKVVDANANIIVGATFDEARKGDVLVSVLATGLGGMVGSAFQPETGAVHNVIARDVVEPVVIEQKKIDVAEEITVATKKAGLKQDLDKSSLVLNEENESATVKVNAIEKDWVNDGDVTIERLNQTQKGEKQKDAVSKKVQDNDHVMSETEPLFVPLPVSSAAVPSRVIPAIDEFSPIAQKAMRAQKEDGKQAENEGNNLFARLSSLGKKLSSSTSDIAAEAEVFKKVEPKVILDESPVDRPTDAEFEGDAGFPVGMELTAEEQMEIPSFFKRKKTG